jgi:hypothetical protein
MQPSSPASTTATTGRLFRGRKVEDLVYQAVTAAAIIVTICSVWLF